MSYPSGTQSEIKRFYGEDDHFQSYVDQCKITTKLKKCASKTPSKIDNHIEGIMVDQRQSRDIDNNANDSKIIQKKQSQLLAFDGKQAEDYKTAINQFLVSVYQPLIINKINDNKDQETKQKTIDPENQKKCEDNRGESKLRQGNKFNLQRKREAKMPIINDLSDSLPLRFNSLSGSKKQHYCRQELKVRPRKVFMKYRQEFQIKEEKYQEHQMTMNDPSNFSGIRNCVTVRRYSQPDSLIERNTTSPFSQLKQRKLLDIPSFYLNSNTETPNSSLPQNTIQNILEIDKSNFKNTSPFHEIDFYVNNLVMQQKKGQKQYSSKLSSRKCHTSQVCSYDEYQTNGSDQKLGDNSFLNNGDQLFSPRSNKKNISFQIPPVCSPKMAKNRILQKQLKLYAEEDNADEIEQKYKRNYFFSTINQSKDIAFYRPNIHKTPPLLRRKQASTTDRSSIKTKSERNESSFLKLDKFNILDRFTLQKIQEPELKAPYFEKDESGSQPIQIYLINNISKLKLFLKYLRKKEKCKINEEEVFNIQKIQMLMNNNLLSYKSALHANHYDKTEQTFKSISELLNWLNEIYSSNYSHVYDDNLCQILNLFEQNNFINSLIITSQRLPFIKSSPCPPKSKKQHSSSPPPLPPNNTLNKAQQQQQYQYPLNFNS